MRRLKLDGLRVTAALVGLLLAALSLTVPRSEAAFVAKVTNSTDTLATIPYFTCAAAITASIPAAGAIYYKLDEVQSATVADDAAVNSIDGTYRGTTTKRVPRACVRDTTSFAVTFDGSTGYITSNISVPAPTTYSSELWFKTNTTRGGLLSGFGVAQVGASLTVDRVLYMTNAGNIVFGVNSVLKNTIASPLTYRDNAWHHALATVGPLGMRLYIDGAQVASSATTATATYTGYFHVAYDSLLLWPSAPTSNFFAGTLDEVVAYGSTLTATDALNHYQAGV